MTRKPRTRRAISLISAVVLVLSGCASARETPSDVQVPPSPRLDAAQQRGHDFAMRRCAGCHAAGLDDGGAQDGPSFRKLANRYNALSLQRRFAEVGEHGFDRMPATSITRAEAEDLVAYFDALRGN